VIRKFNQFGLVEKSTISKAAPLRLKSPEMKTPE
jgi:hypothetical protein